MKAISAEGHITLADRIKQAFTEADADSGNLAETTKMLYAAIVNDRKVFGQGVAPLILHRRAFPEVLAETGLSPDQSKSCRFAQIAVRLARKWRFSRF